MQTEFMLCKVEIMEMIKSHYSVFCPFIK